MDNSIHKEHSLYKVSSPMFPIGTDVSHRHHHLRHLLSFSFLLFCQVLLFLLPHPPRPPPLLPLLHQD